MAISVTCPGCGKTFKVADSAAGKKGACPECRSIIRIPDGPTPAVETAPAAASWRPGEVFPAFAGHCGAVNFISLSRGSTIALTAGQDGTIRVWNVESGRQRAVLRGHCGAVNCARFDADGNYVISCGDDRTVRIWNLANGKCLRILEGHTGAVASAAFHPTGPLAASGEADGTLRLWDIKAGKCLRARKAHKGGVHAVDCTAVDDMVLSAGEDRTIAIWRFTNGKPAGRLSGHGGPVRAACFSDDGAFIVSGSVDRTAVAWRVGRDRPVRVFTGHEGIVRAVALSADNRLLASGADDWTLRVWNTDSGECVFSHDTEQQSVTAVAMDAGGHEVMSGEAGGAVRLWETVSGELARTFGGGERAATVRCPSCRRSYQVPAAVVGGRGLCPGCGGEFVATAYSPERSGEASRRGALLLHENEVEQALKAFRAAIDLQADNHAAILGAMSCLWKMGTDLAEARQDERAVEALEAALPLYAKGEPWPLEHVTASREAAYRAAFLAGKTCRRYLQDRRRALAFLQTAQKIQNTPEIEDMIAHTLAAPDAQRETT